MIRYIKIIKDNSICIYVDNKFIETKKGDIIIFKNNRLYLNNLVTDEFNREGLLRFINFLNPLNYDNDKNDEYKIYNEQEYRDQKLNTLLDENILH